MESIRRNPAAGVSPHGALNRMKTEPKTPEGAEPEPCSKCPFQTECRDCCGGAGLALGALAGGVGQSTTPETHSLVFQPTSGWLANFMPISPAGIEDVNSFEATVRGEAAALGHPLHLRGASLVRLKGRLARIGYSGMPPYTQIDISKLVSQRAKLRQFILGSINLDFRDSASIGHGMAIAMFAPPKTIAYWGPRMKEGMLVGAAATESQGGTNKHQFTCRMEQGLNGWRLYGRKVSVSRIYEAGAFVVYGQVPGNALTAVVIDANAPGIFREERQPAGLQGWAWGVLRFEGTPFHDEAFIGQIGGGHKVFAAHFSAFRPLVAATALGAAANVWRLTREDLQSRLATGQIKRPRDTAEEALAYHKTKIRNALLGVLVGPSGIREAIALDEESAMCGKADAVETALEAVRDLRVLVSAEKSMIAGELFDKTLRDLEAYRFADGLNSELWRAAGKRLLD